MPLSMRLIRPYLEAGEWMGPSTGPQARELLAECRLLEVQDRAGQAYKGV